MPSKTTRKDYILSYEKPGQINFIQGKFDENIKLIEEYIEFNTGDSAWRFDVNNKTKQVHIYPADVSPGFDGIQDEMKFKLWEDSYSDIIYPGKIEKIHIDTRVRSCSFESHDDLDIFKDCPKFRIDFDFTPQRRNILRYKFTTVSAASLWMIYLKLRASNQSMPIFLPTPPIVPQVMQVKTFERSKDNIITSPYNNEWLVFSKTTPDKFYVVGGYGIACSLLAQLKFGGLISTFICGTALFEDYYFMPIFYETIEYNHKTDMIKMRTVKEEILDAIETYR